MPVIYRTITLTLEFDNPTLRDFRWFWGKVVHRFNPKQHCARCLVGPWVSELSPKWLAGEAGRVTVQVPDGSFLYVCGVASPYVWDNNFHLALRPVEGARPISAPTYNGGIVHATGAEEVGIPSEPAASQFPDLDRSFLTCRNFQFGAAVLGHKH